VKGDESDRYHTHDGAGEVPSGSKSIFPGAWDGGSDACWGVNLARSLGPSHDPLEGRVIPWK
jgi:hypothetical protein